MKKIVPIVVLLLVLLNFNENHVAVALSCAPPKALLDEYNNSSIVFLGTALNTNTENGKVNFQVKTIWKGSSDSIAEGIMISNMWKEIEEGKDYLMFVNYREDQLEANICGNSMFSSEFSQEQISELGTGQIIEQQVVEKKNVEEQIGEMQSIDGRYVWQTGALVILIASLMTVSIYLKKKK